jgi:serine/threonine-protein kinase
MGDLPAEMVINGKYRVEALVATGGMGSIYVAEQVGLGRRVALKVLRTPSHRGLEEQFRRRFEREASILAKLQHVNVVTLFDYGRIETGPGDGGDRYFMAMEYLPGETLEARLRAVFALAPQDALRILRQIARGLREAHKLGAVHRDLKPTNVMLVPEEDGGEVVKILDFGIGKLLAGSSADEASELTQEGSFLGSPRYIAPEQVNERRVDARTDVYALGVIAYECLCGRVPFERETNLETVLAHCHDPVPPMSERAPDLHVPELVERFVLGCLEKEPDRRPPSMEAVLRGISDCERALFGVTSLASGPADLAARRPQRISPDDRTLASSPEPVADPTSTNTHATVTRSGSVSPRGGSRASLALGGVVAALLVVGLLAARSALHHGPAHSGATAAAASPDAPPVPIEESFVLTVDSVPPGADVVDGERTIGATPLDVSIDRGAARARPRRFVLRLDGYVPYTIDQGPSDVPVRVVAALEPIVPQRAVDAAPAARPPRPPTRPAAPASHPPQEPDIKLTR